MTHTPEAWEGGLVSAGGSPEPSLGDSEAPSTGARPPGPPGDQLGTLQTRAPGRSPDHTWHVAASAVPPHCLVAK